MDRSDPKVVPYRNPEELARATYPASDWWVVRDGAVHLHRMPLEGESLPVVERLPQPPFNHCGGGWVFPVIGPDGERLTYGHSSE